MVGLINLTVVDIDFSCIRQKKNTSALASNYTFYGKKSLLMSCAVSYFYETEFEVWAGFGAAGQFCVHEFLVLFKTILP